MMRRNILVLGGTGYFGKHLTDLLLSNGDNVTIATRGNNIIPEGCNFVKLDRNNGEQLSFSEEFDLIYDQSCYMLQHLSCVENVSKSCGKYILTSSQSVYSAGINIPENAVNYDSIAVNTSGISPYGIEKIKSEELIIDSNPSHVFPRFPVIVGSSDPRGRIQKMVTMIESGSIDLPASNPYLQFIDEYDAAKALFDVGVSDYIGSINIASHQIVSSEYICKFLSTEIGVDLKINWILDYSSSGFDLIKSESKTLSLDRQNQLGLSVKSADNILKNIINEMTR